MRFILYTLLAVVAAAAAVLSFSALRDLALVCGFDPSLAWLLPIVIDAGAAAGSIVWLGEVAPASARNYGRALAIALLASSVGGNTVGHILTAFELRPAWWVVVGVSAIAPVVVLTVVHLIVLARRAPMVLEPWQPRLVENLETDVQPPGDPSTTPGSDHLTRVREIVAEGGGRSRVMDELDVSEHRAKQLLRAVRPTGDGLEDAQA